MRQRKNGEKILRGRRKIRKERVGMGKKFIKTFSYGHASAKEGEELHEKRKVANGEWRGHI